MINDVIDAAPDGATIWFTSGAPCRIRESIIIDKQLTITTAPGGLLSGKAEIVRIDHGGEDGYPRYDACAGHGGGAIFDVQASDVTIADMRLTGAEYGPIGARNTHGIWAAPQLGRLSGVTVKNCELTNFRGRGVGLVRVDDFVIEGNHIEDVGYAGIGLEDVRRGQIAGNTVVDVSNPEVCDPAPNCDMCGRCDCYETEPGATSTYGIVVTGCSTADNCSEDVVISGNTVKHNRHWAGIMNHGGQRILVVDNVVEDTEILYANTVKLPEDMVSYQASSATWFVNNRGDIKPRGRVLDDDGVLENPDQDGWYNPTRRGIGQWFVGRPENVTQDVAAIGNVYENCGFLWPVWPPSDDPITSVPCVDVYAVDGLTFTHNEIDGEYSSRYSVRFLSQTAEGSVANGVLAHNLLRNAYFAGIRAQIPGESVLVTDNEISAPYTVEFGLDMAGTWDIEPGQSNMGVLGNYTSISIPESVPPTPSLAAIPGPNPDQVELRWDGYPEVGEAGHDSFYLFDFFNGQFNRVAYRPANDPRWRFASSNPNYEAFDTLGYSVDDLEAGVHWFGIRAQNGSQVSGLSVVQVNVP